MGCNFSASQSLSSFKMAPQCYCCLVVVLFHQVNIYADHVMRNSLHFFVFRLFLGSEVNLDLTLRLRYNERKGVKSLFIMHA